MNAKYLSWLARRGGGALALALFLCAEVPRSFAVEESPRRVVLGGTVGEIVVALAGSDGIVGVDASCLYPPELSGKPVVGYYRTFSAEGVLALRPTQVIASMHAGPPEALQQLRDAGVNLVVIEDEKSPQGVVEAIHQIGDALNCKAKADQLADAVARETEAAIQQASFYPARTRALFVLSQAGAQIMVAGGGTAADGMLNLAGGENVCSDFSGYRPLNPEHLASLNPEIVLFTSEGFKQIGGQEGALKLPGLNLTSAGRNGRVAAMDDLLLLGFGPRLGLAVAQLTRILHP